MPAVMVVTLSDKETETIQPKLTIQSLQRYEKRYHSKRLSFFIISLDKLALLVIRKDQMGESIQERTK